jgi:hypothetical protein
LRFIGLLHTTRATVATFNYDTLIEGAAARTFDQQLGQMINTFSITDGIPATPSPGMFGPTMTPSFRLLKLHGSVDTYWVPGDLAGATILRVTDSVWVPGGGMSNPNLNIARLAPGRVPFVVPPASAKSAFFANPITRQLWRTAAQGLAMCDRIVVIGYSVPPTDIVASAMLVDAQRINDACIDVVNPDPDPVIQHLVTDAGVPARQVRLAASSCEEYVDQLERQVSLDAGNAIQFTLRVSRPLAVAGMAGQVRPVLGLRRVGGEVHLDVAEPVTREEGLDTGSWIKSNCLIEVLEQSGAEHMSVVINGENALVIDHYVWPNPEADRAFVVLGPSAIRLPE